MCVLALLCFACYPCCVFFSFFIFLRVVFTFFGLLVSPRVVLCAPHFPCPVSLLGFFSAVRLVQGAFLDPWLVFGRPNTPGLCFPPDLESSRTVLRFTTRRLELSRWYLWGFEPAQLGSEQLTVTPYHSLPGLESKAHVTGQPPSPRPWFISVAQKRISTRNGAVSVFVSFSSPFGSPRHGLLRTFFHPFPMHPTCMFS